MLRRGVPAQRLTVLPQLGLDIARYASGDAARARSAGGPPPDGPPVVGFVGRVVSEKGVDVLVDAVDGLAARLLVVGDGAARADLQARTARWPAGKATFVGAVADAAVPDWIACMDVLVLPSRTIPSWAEQFGHVLIEAMAAGVPVIGSSSGAIPEVIGEAGLVFPEDDPVGLRAQLAFLLEDLALRKRLVEQGRARVARLYTNERVARVQRAIYANLLAERR
jgi:glycosyltransferase involved in cell wall biosynthesis